jgi:D-3-phosphoglycerate dehydrogenase
VIKALEEKKIAGAAIDVFEKEPVSADNPLLAMDNVVKMPHSAFYSDAAFKRLKVSVAREAGLVLSGHWPRNYVNKGVKPKVPLS